MPLVGDRVRSASRPHRSLRRLRRRLFASAPPPMHQPSHAPGPAAAGRRYRRALVKSSPDASPRCAPDLVALHPRPHLSPPSSPPPPMIPPFAPSRYADHNGVRNVRISLENGQCGVCPASSVGSGTVGLFIINYYCQNGSCSARTAKAAKGQNTAKTAGTNVQREDKKDRPPWAKMDLGGQKC